MTYQRASLFLPVRSSLRSVPWGAVCLALAAASAWSARATEAQEDFRRIDAPVPLVDTSWVPRELKKAPPFKSANVRYNLWVLGEGRGSAMVLAWDESGGAGTGYDTLYADKNLNGDLTDEGEAFFCENYDKAKHANRLRENYDLGAVKSADGSCTATFKLKAGYKDDCIEYPFEISVASARGNFGVGPLPGNLNLAWSNDLKTAPVYVLGGEAMPEVNGKKPGESLGTWTAGLTYDAWYTVKLYGGDAETHLRFIGAKAGIASPATFLRVKDGQGAVVEEIAFVGGCVCGGGYGQHLMIPSRVPPGRHEVVARTRRTPNLGGNADFIFPVTVENPGYGKPLVDPALAALKAQFPSARLVALRRAGPDLKLSQAAPDEPLASAVVGDTYLIEDSPSYSDEGHDQRMVVGSMQGDGRRHLTHALLRFDLSALPRDARILGAQLRVTMLQTSQYAELKDGAALEAYAMRRAWIEARRGPVATVPATNWHGPELIYTGPQGNPPVVRWGKPGAEDTEADRFPEPLGAATAGPFPRFLEPAANPKDPKAPREPWRMVAIELTAAAKQWHAGTLPNHGVLLKLNGAGAVYLCASEFPDYPFRPTLVLAYEGGEPLRVPDAPEENLVLARKLAAERRVPLAVEFYGKRCGACKRADETTFADEAVKKALREQVQFVRLDIQDYAQLAQDLGVAATPALVLLDALKDGPAGKQKLIEGATILDKNALLAALKPGP
ncbi:MAG: thioredoxin family protein [Planctomycetota bacterium]|nr:thioredoxin family protein [Planctomycetota bacterium]